MQDGFDPYYKWLGIPPQDQPPDHYRLLAIPLFESDPEVIESAADQRMGHVRTFQRGRYGALSQQILNELASARVCLLSSNKKLAYDAELQTQLAPVPPLPPPPQSHGTVLPSPPPPFSRPPEQPVPSHEGGHILPPPAGSVLSQPAILFPPLDATLPDPAPPATKAQPVTQGGARHLSLVASALGVTLLLFAAAGFWILYANQETHDTNISRQPAPDTHARSTSDRASSDDAVNREPSAEPVLEEEMPETASDLAIPSESAEGPDMPSSPDEEPVELPPEPSLTVADVLKQAEPESPDPRSLADLPEQTPTTMEDTQPALEEPVDSPTEAKAPKKSRIPSPAVFTRVATDLQSSYAQADYVTLIAEAQRPDRPSPQAYVLLTWARKRAVLAHSAEDALQALEITETMFIGNTYDQERVLALTTIQRQVSSDRRLSGDLAAVAWQASRDALEAENKPLALRLGNIAHQAARSSRQASLEEQIATYLRGI